MEDGVAAGMAHSGVVRALSVKPRWEAQEMEVSNQGLTRHEPGIPSRILFWSPQIRVMCEGTKVHLVNSTYCIRIKYKREAIVWVPKLKRKSLGGRRQDSFLARELRQLRKKNWRNYFRNGKKGLLIVGWKRITESLVPRLDRKPWLLQRRQTSRGTAATVWRFRTTDTAPTRLSSSIPVTGKSSMRSTFTY